VGTYARSALVFTYMIFGSLCANAAPRSLYGNTVVVTWQEEHQQKRPEDDQIKSIGGWGEFDVYVSDAGRPFSRLRFSMMGRRENRRGGGLRTGTKDAVGGEGGAVRNVAFSGNTMTASMARGAGGALLVSVTFDNGFQSCSARTVSGKAPGAVAARIKSIINGGIYDLYSVKTSGESCRIQNGNMFAQ
jgi:hypothetical protein